MRARTPAARSASSPTSAAEEDIAARGFARPPGRDAARIHGSRGLREFGASFRLRRTAKSTAACATGPGDQRLWHASLRCAPAPDRKGYRRIWADSGPQARRRHDNFFDLGGNSLLAVLVIGEINKTLKARLNVPAFFQNPTIEGLTRVLEQKDHVGPEPQVVRLQPGIPVCRFISSAPGQPNIGSRNCIGEDRAIFATDAPMPVEWSTAHYRRGPAAQPTDRTTGRLLRRFAACACWLVALRGCGILPRGQDSIRSSASTAACRGQCRVRPSPGCARAFSGSIRGPASESLRWIWRGAATRTANDPPYMDRLSASLRNSWRLLCVAARADSSAVKGRLQLMQCFRRDSPFGLFR